ncbi:type II toxin-antitoxin system prevent-host-death family antitoxin [Natronosporangium hydrolyticum]|uniref:Antitoxin n=1 Tax=Natronosporangium hydrolyticum TaxID=2811111 RepID=A0A895YLI7_9ACTN|nr:type II toxin-antitoxin system prevent-host-death family antitoxin [Natronosporangium hydrolyticum]QSB16842.1 type II toxin-antitoxin system prevent-host-death family antitoxin [Natronosporangium hydrolyticum]
MATTVTLRELTHRAGSLVDRAHAGEVIMITRNGRPWARLVPELSQTGSDYLDQLLAEGRVSSPTADFSDYTVPAATGEWRGEDAAEVISDQRDDRL